MQDTTARVLSCEPAGAGAGASHPFRAGNCGTGQGGAVHPHACAGQRARAAPPHQPDGGGRGGGHADAGDSAKGAGTQMLCACKPGETIRVLGPLGTGFDGRGAACVYFVGGGVGVAPICCAMDAFATAESRAFFGFRTAAHAYGMTQSPCAVTAVSDDGSLGERALVTRPLEAAILARRPDLVMACGPDADAGGGAGALRKI